MNPKIWHRLLYLESYDATYKRLTRLGVSNPQHHRVHEIIAAAKQAREYFRNTDASSLSVRPLLAYYGVASLSRALILLLKSTPKQLTASHGLTTIKWNEILSDNMQDSLERLGRLAVRTSRGLFADLMTHTDNRTSIHANSAGVDWHLNYGIPTVKNSLSVDDLFSRMPDLRQEYVDLGGVSRQVEIRDMRYRQHDGFRFLTAEKTSTAVLDTYLEKGYVVGEKGHISCSVEVFSENMPLIYHTYVNKMMDLIPLPFLVEPFPGGARYSELCLIFAASYVLGMLVRYYPSHWIALIHGEKGDSWLPTVVRAQEIVEQVYPLLVAELIEDVLAKANEQSTQ